MIQRHIVALTEASKIGELDGLTTANLLAKTRPRRAICAAHFLSPIAQFRKKPGDRLLPNV